MVGASLRVHLFHDEEDMFADDEWKLAVVANKMRSYNYSVMISVLPVFALLIISITRALMQHLHLSTPCPM